MRFHDVAHEAAGLLGVGDAESADALTDESPHRGGVEALGQVAFAERDLEAELRGLLRALFARLSYSTTAFWNSLR